MSIKGRYILNKKLVNYAEMLLYCLTKISIRAKRSIFRVYSLFIVPSPFFVHCPYKGRINWAESVLTGLKRINRDFWLLSLLLRMEKKPEILVRQ